MHDLNVDIKSYSEMAQNLLQQALSAGATQAEVHCQYRTGLITTVREQAVDTLSYLQSHSVTITVYFSHQKGQAITTDLSAKTLKSTVEAACRIAKQTQFDEAAGLASPHTLAKSYPDLDLYHTWPITASEAIEKAKACEAEALATDKRIIHAEGVSVYKNNTMSLYANTHGFMGHYFSSQHSMDCTLVARDDKGNMQRDGSYTISRDPAQLKTSTMLAKKASHQTIRRLSARQISTRQVPVIFEAEVATGLIGYFLNAISGRALYQKRSFLLDHYQQAIFPSFVTISDRPYIKKGLGSAPFDMEGVAPQSRDLIKDGVLQGYLLSSYSARRLGLETTGNAGGTYNIEVTTQEPDLETLLTKMGEGLLVTEVIGSGVNLVTGDYSQGAAGFWVENGKIQYPVEEITIAGNLRDMYQNIIAIAGDIDQESTIGTGSILIKTMMIAGK